MRATLKAVNKVAGPFGAPGEFVLSLYDDQQAGKKKAELDAAIAQGQELSRETLEQLIEIRQLRTFRFFSETVC